MPTEETFGVSTSHVKADVLRHRSGGTAGFYGTEPIVQPVNIADATNTTTTTSTTTALTTDLDSLRTKFNSLLTTLESLGLIAAA
jgi:hypothetical protein